MLVKGNGTACQFMSRTATEMRCRVLFEKHSGGDGGECPR